VQRQRAAINRTTRIIEAVAEQLGQEILGGARNAAELIVAYDTGLGLHNLIDPASARPGFSETLLTLRRLWTSQA